MNENVLERDFFLFNFVLFNNIRTAVNMIDCFVFYSVTTAQSVPAILTR